MNCKGIQLFDFLAGHLTASDEKTVARHLEACPGCQQRFWILLHLDLTPVHSRVAPGKFTAAACVLLLLVSGALIMLGEWREDQPTTGLTESSLPLRLRGENVPPRDAVEAFRNERWQEVLVFTNGLPETPELVLMEAEALYRLHRLEDSRSRLKRQIFEINRHERRRVWLLAHIALDQHSLLEATRLLETLASSEGDLQKEASEILQALKRGNR